MGIIWEMFLSLVKEWNRVCKIGGGKFCVELGVDLVYMWCCFIIGKSWEKWWMGFVGVSLGVILKKLLSEGGRG